MDNKFKKKHNAFISEEEKTLNWQEIQDLLRKHSEAKFTIVGCRKFHLLKSTMTI